MLILADDRLIVRNAIRAAEELGLPVSTAAAAPEAPPTVVIVDLDMPDAAQVVAEAKGRSPTTMVVGVLSQPSGEMWTQAEDRGCDAVTSRGALRKTLLNKVPPWLEAPGGRRVRLFAIDDIAGRLGLVMRIEDSPVGPLAVFHIAGEILAVEDRCPHAGATLSQGPVSLDDGIVTCPEHGSRFDTQTGERVRGPADDPIRTFRVSVEDGSAYVHVS